ncbi:MAG: 16S rRNA (cytosine(1402)-N(4))-methyltransferase RsmH [Candidatus Omnitrophica bacterium]|nr:16S rRNA (cytosine(1402)-N(4))-methyltransferase RsmH [Candidatus Omnitrophota bacterium]
MVYHVPVMPDEVIKFLNLKPGQLIVDATMGTGGHSEMILERITPKGRLIGIDRDKDSLEICRRRLERFTGTFQLVHGNFAQVDVILKDLKIKKIDGILFDLGISTFQLKDKDRGFSFLEEGPLDMRMDRTSYFSAYDLVNNLKEKEISDLLWSFGEERWHNRIARIIVEERERHPITTTAQLANIAARSVPVRYRHSHYKIHPATRTFQAVRIAVNRELEILEGALNKGIEFLKIKGRICVISFHSLEDRIAKHTFKKAQAEGLINILTPKPLTPAQLEVESNPSSRSSKFRAAEKI